MDVSKWTPEQILTLPDWVFGRRFPVCLSLSTDWGVEVYDISEQRYPDPIVLWFLTIFPVTCAGTAYYIRLALGNELPASEAEMMTFLPLIHGLGAQGPEPRKLPVRDAGGILQFPMRTIVRTEGRRLCGGFFAAAAAVMRAHVITIVSAVPREVPDWLFSALAKSQ